MPSAIDLTKRALVILLQSLVASYGVVLNIQRDSPDSEITSAYRKVSRKTHPDRGGRVEDQTDRVILGLAPSEHAPQGP